MVKRHICSRGCGEESTEDQITQNGGKCPRCNKTIACKKCGYPSEKLSSTLKEIENPLYKASRIDHKYKCPRCGEKQELHDHGPFK